MWLAFELSVVVGRIVLSCHDVVAWLLNRSMPRFVILRHETPSGFPRESHFDLMLQRANSLRTWAMERLPALGEDVSAERLPDHRLAYLDYEGKVSGERGTVSRVDAGDYECLMESETQFVVRVSGQMVRGTLTLIAEEDETHRWRVSLSED
jgi:DNA polymerase Ligase (LigD)